MNEILILEQQQQILSELKAIKELLLLPPVSHAPPMSLQQAAAFLGLQPGTIYQLVHSGKIQPLQRKKKGRLLFTQASLLQFLQP